MLDDELIRWKREQQLAGNGTSFNSNLDNIQEWCEALAEIIWLNRQQIKEAERLKQKLTLEPPGVVDILPSLNSQITQLLSSLVTRYVLKFFAFILAGSSAQVYRNASFALLTDIMKYSVQ